MTPRHFLFMVCQSGAENALKNEVTRRHPTFRFSFSRPGFVTFATPEDMARDRKFQPNCTFTRTWGYSLGKVNGTDPQQLVAETWALLVSRFPKDVLSQFRHLHVWERDADVPGENGFEPGISVLADEMGELLLAAPFVRGVATHGTGCTYSAAIAAHCARGLALPAAVRRSKTFITRAIATSYHIGKHTALNPVG